MRKWGIATARISSTVVSTSRLGRTTQRYRRDLEEDDRAIEGLNRVLRRLLECVQVSSEGATFVVGEPPADVVSAARAMRIEQFIESSRFAPVK